MPANLADKPRRQGGEKVELFPRVGGHGKVMSANMENYMNCVGNVCTIDFKK